MKPIFESKEKFRSRFIEQYSWAPSSALSIAQVEAHPVVGWDAASRHMYDPTACLSKNIKIYIFGHLGPPI